MKRTWVILLALTMVVCLVACSSGTTAGTTTAGTTTAATTTAGTTTGSPEKTSLSFWYWADSSELSATFQKCAKLFNETNDKNITVTAEEYPWEGGGYTDSVFKALMGGGGPDISAFKLQAGKVFAANNLLADLGSLVDSWADKGQIKDSTWQMMKDATGDNTLSIFPFSLEALYVYYRPSYFAQAGITSVPTTFDEFLEDIKKCTMDTNKDGKTDVYGYGLRGATGGQEHLGSFLYAYGANWDNLASPEAVQAYNAYLDIFKNGYTPESSPNSGYAEMTDGFKTGLTAMIIHHIGSSNIWLEQFGDDVDAFPMPGSDKGRWTCTGDTDLIITKQCQNTDAAFEFLQFMTTGEGGTTFFKDTGKGLGTDNVRATEEFTSNRFQKVAAESLGFSGVLPMTDTLTEFINNVWSNTNQQALLGQISTEDALKTMQEAIHGK